MKRKTVLFIVIVAFVGLCLYSLWYDDTDEIGKRYEIDLSGTEIISDTDTHGGFFGDGERCVVFDASEWKKREEILSSWDALPLTENLQLIMYGGEKDGMIYGYDLAMNNDIPVITDGKYFFYDRRHEIYSDNDLFSGASFNFTIFMYDNNTEKLYMLEFDT